MYKFKLYKLILIDLSFEDVIVNSHHIMKCSNNISFRLKSIINWPSRKFCKDLILNSIFVFNSNIIVDLFFTTYYLIILNEKCLYIFNFGPQ